MLSFFFFSCACVKSMIAFFLAPMYVSKCAAVWRICSHCGKVACLPWIYLQAYREKWSRCWQTTVFCTERLQSMWELCILNLDLSTGMWREVEKMVADYSVLYGEIAVNM